MPLKTAYHLPPTAHLDQYFGIWAIQEEPFRAAVNRVQGLDLSVHIRDQEPEDGEQRSGSRGQGTGGYTTTDSVAIIKISGPMMKHVSSLGSGTSTVLVRRQVRAAVADDSVKAILLLIDSPGGTVSGTYDLADDVRIAASKKPLYAYIEDLGASAAYAVASQATRIYANRTAVVGSIGTFGVLYDYSAQAAMIGVKVHVLRAGQFKGATEPGIEITKEQLAEWQSLVDALNEHFIATVAAGRKLSVAAVGQLADGRVHVGQAAKEMKLIDGVQTLDQTLQELTKLSLKNRSTTTMSENKENTAAIEPIAATYADLKAGCPGANSDFICSQLEKKATAEQAKVAWMEEQNKRLEAAAAKTKEIEAAAEKKVADAEAAARKPGVDALGGTAGDGKGNTDPADAWNAAVAEKVKAGMSKPRAIAAVVKGNPELHQEYLDAANQGSGVRG